LGFYKYAGDKELSNHFDDYLKFIFLDFYTVVLRRIAMKEINRLAVLLVLVSMVVGAGINSIEVLSELHEVAEGEGFHFVKSQAIFLYIWLPILTVSAAIFLLGPGLLLSLLFSKEEETYTGWILKGFALSIPILFIGAIFAQNIFVDVVFTSLNYYLLVLVFNFIAFFGIVRAENTCCIHWKIFSQRWLETVLIIVTPVAVLLICSAKFYWENFNGDGAHALFSALLMINETIPFWTEEAGDIGSYPSMTTLLEVFTNSWFVRLLGVHEFSVRMSFLLGLGLMFVVVLEFVRYGRQRENIKIPALCIALALILYSFVLAYNASYDFYFADIALPMGREPIIVFSLLGFAYFFLTGQFLWMGIYALITYIAVPSGPLLMVAWLAAVALVWRPFPLRACLAGCASLAIVIFIGKSIPIILTYLGLIGGADEFSTSNLLERLRYVSIQDWNRMAYWALPTGIVPAAAVLVWGWHDRIAKVFALVVIGYVVFFYVQAYRVLPHHFAPAMILSLVVLWRIKPIYSSNGRRLAAVVSVGGVVLSAWLSWPPTLRPHTYSRDFAQTIDIVSSESRQFNGGQIYKFHEVMQRAFPGGWTEEAGEERYIFSPLSWYYYASSYHALGQNAPYKYGRKIQDSSQQGLVLAQFDGYQLTVSNMATYEQDQLNPGIKMSINEIYFVPREIVFGKGERWGQRRVFDLARVPDVLGLR